MSVRKLFLSLLLIGGRWPTQLLLLPGPTCPVSPHLPSKPSRSLSLCLSWPDTHSSISNAALLKQCRWLTVLNRNANDGA